MLHIYIIAMMPDAIVWELERTDKTGMEKKSNTFAIEFWVSTSL